MFRLPPSPWAKKTHSIGPQAECERSRIVCASARRSACVIERPDITLNIRDAPVAPDQDNLCHACSVQFKMPVCRAAAAAAAACREWRNEDRIFQFSAFSRRRDR